MKTCFFTGHRSFSLESDPDFIDKFGNVLDDLANAGVTDYYAGGAYGWDAFCALSVLIMKGYFPNIKLHLVLPCPPEVQTAKWTEKARAEYNIILKEADDVEIVSEYYDKNCMKKRNARLVECGDICVCYFNEKDSRSGTGQTVRMAKESGKEIINMYNSL